MGPVDLIVAAFPEEGKADEVLKSLKKLDKEGIIDILNAAVLIKDKDGKAKMKETQDVDAKRGAVFGAIAGGLLGLLGGPPGVVLGAAAGATAGGVAAHKIDMGFSDDSLEEIQAGLQPGSSAVIALIEHEWVDRILAELDKFGAKVFTEVLKEEVAEQLKVEQEEGEEEKEE